MGLFDKIQDIENYNKDLADKEIETRRDNVVDSLTSAWNQTADALSSPSSWNLDTFSNDKIDDLLTNTSDTVGSLFNLFGAPDKFSRPRPLRAIIDNPFVDGEVAKQGITGLYNYKTPTESQFEKCQEIGGLSVWNTKGWWRCLFPNAVVQKNLDSLNIKDNIEDNVLTREKVESDKDHQKYGLFFTDFSNYLQWRLHMNRLIKEKEQQKYETDKLIKSDDFFSTTPENLMVDEPSNFGSTNGKTVVGQSKNVSYSSTLEGKERLKEWKTYYDDGSVSIKRETKIEPADGGKPRTEVTTSLIPPKK
ncbi:hypothetical protein Kpol_1027p24 [Vanderwaltozyma polyspora DSM 70294]|uniref:Mitochondrial peculiar membrane protein 1 n=1 Tax=Vanderwaltozyma polyspora (strain ATCC 22028 / DSM 70294 / BCRC 21397 / CBS 2163 / NBRC 10782 / NRRL Y-8283 / UCD 57-17) TaxID=436907 RepID=A7TQM8_VANPO|nr:uncharacterized protein Kpol_1027p24 [Vanderwaltozyma polyspora DSM 70294]EDO15449.1 hypothetical protein Kpol_1027p24 [Vanderwaltozyma polyspora DSM 70294]